MVTAVGRYVCRVAPLMLLLVVLSACSHSSEHTASSGSGSPAPPSASAVRIGSDSDGKQISLPVGRQLVVSLAADMTTGYQWQAEQFDQAVLKQDGDPDYRPDAGSGQLAGAGGTSVWTFTAVAPGTTTLTLGYQRPWEQGVPPAQRFTVTVRVE